MQIAVWQIVIITVLAFLYRIERYGTQVLNYNAVLYAWIVGLILGDGLTGLTIGASVQLMSLGVAAIAGSSVPDWPLGAMVGTVITITTGQDMGVGLAAGIAVGTLGVQLDVVAKVLNGFMARKQTAYAQAGEYSKMKRVTFLGPLFFGLTDAIPMFLVLLFGEAVVNGVISAMPAWFTTGCASLLHARQAVLQLPCRGLRALRLPGPCHPAHRHSGWSCRLRGLQEADQRLCCHDHQ